MATLGTRMLGNTGGQPPKVDSVSEHALPPIPLDHWTLTVVEVNFPAGSCSCPHSHPGFVVGYVLQGEVRFQSKGKAEKVYHAGQVFYEPPGSVHEVSANASTQHPARILVLRFAKPDASKLLQHKSHT